MRQLQRPFTVEIKKKRPLVKPVSAGVRPALPVVTLKRGKQA